MTERIQQIIDEIRQKSEKVHYLLKDERLKNAALLAEIQELKENQEVLKKSENACLTEIKELKMELEVTKSQIVEISGPSIGKKDEEIDELVKEIEYCISQLKK